MEYDMKKVLKDCKELGIINIEASCDLTPDLVAEAVQAVKDTALDFDKLALQMEKERASFTK